MPDFKLYDVIYAAKDLSSLVTKGTTGTILMDFNDSNYEVEFVDLQNETLEILTVNSRDFLIKLID